MVFNFILFIFQSLSMTLEEELLLHKESLKLVSSPGYVPFLSQPLGSSASSRQVFRPPWSFSSDALAAGGKSSFPESSPWPFRVTCKLCKLSSLLGCETKFLPQSFCFESLLFEFFCFLHFSVEPPPCTPNPSTRNLQAIKFFVALLT